MTNQLNFEFLSKQPSETLIGNDIDYYKLFSAIKRETTSCYLFESLALPKHQDRYFTIGFDPVIELIARGNQLTVTGQADMIERVTGIANTTQVTISTANPYQLIQQQLPLTFLSKPHQGGLIGYFSYESVNYFEPAIQLPEHPDYATFHLGLYTDGLIFDSEINQLSYYTFTEDRSEWVRRLLHNLDDIHIPTQLESVHHLGYSENREQHAQAIENTLEEIRKGNTLQAEVGFQSHYTIQGDKIAIYNRLRQINPSPYMYYVKFDQVELLGASPEILISSQERRVLTTPAAGTIRRSPDPQEDRRLSRQLLSDPKEIAEHNMLIDLHRNDLARVCEVGSVRIFDLMYVMRFSHVQHIVSNIIGELAREKSVYDLLAAILPGGVLSGAPKIETMKIISRNEGVPRGPYGGAVGRFSLNGDATFCLPIRSLFCYGDRCFTQACSGVVYDSTVEREYEEVREKLAAMEQTISELGEVNT